MNCKTLILTITGLMLLCSFQLNEAQLHENNCPEFCVCSFVNFILTIRCTKPQANFQLPSIGIDPDLALTTSITVANSFIQSIPLNLCSYPNLVFLDLSNNSISGTLYISNFGCLNKLKQLRLSYNKIDSIANNLFGNFTALDTLDLSHNQISTIPRGLFDETLSKLANLYLSNNLLTEIEMWPLYMTNLNYLDLKNNKITKFSNSFGFDIQKYKTSIPVTSSVDLRNNLISKFNDETIQQYGVCSFQAFESFINAIKTFWFSSNPLECSCDSSKLLKDFQSISISLLANLFTAQCSSPNAYANKLWFNFESNCPVSSSYIYCNNTKQTTISIATTPTKPTTNTFHFGTVTYTIPISSSPSNKPLYTILSLIFMLHAICQSIKFINP